MIRFSKKLPTNVLDKIPKIVGDMSLNKDVVAFYILGSAASGNLKPLSDIDFGLLLTSKMTGRQQSDMHSSLLAYLCGRLETDEVDLVLLNDAPPRIAYTIIRDGRLLLCHDEREFTDFLDDTVRAYLDFKFYRDDFDSTFLQTIGYHG